MSAPLVRILQSHEATAIIHLLSAENELQQIAIARAARISRTTAIKWLHIMAEMKIVTEKRVGKGILYKINSEHPVLKQLKILLNIAALVPLVAQLAPNEVYLFGSTARGEDTARSDIDILIIGKPDLRAVARWAGATSKRLGREIKPIIKNPIEYARLIRTDRIFYENVERNKIRLV